MLSTWCWLLLPTGSQATPVMGNQFSTQSSPISNLGTCCHSSHSTRHCRRPDVRSPPLARSRDGPASVEARGHVVSCPKSPPSPQTRAARSLPRGLGQSIPPKSLHACRHPFVRFTLGPPHWINRCPWLTIPRAVAFPPACCAKLQLISHAGRRNVQAASVLQISRSGPIALRRNWLAACRSSTGSRPRSPGSAGSLTAAAPAERLPPCPRPRLATDMGVQVDELTCREGTEADEDEPCARADELIRCSSVSGNRRANQRSRRSIRSPRRRSGGLCGSYVLASSARNSYTRGCGLLAGRGN
jgi:hypothetical protein